MDTKEVAEGRFHGSSFSDQEKEGKVIISLFPNVSATKVACDVLKFLSMRDFRTHFIDRQDATSFRALHCNPLPFSVIVKPLAQDVHTVDFFHHDPTRHKSLIHTGGQVGKIEASLSVEDEMKVSTMAGNAFRALRCAFLKKSEAELHEVCFNFGRPTSGHWVGRPVIAGTITSKECSVTRAGSAKRLGCSELSLLTEKLFS